MNTASLPIRRIGWLAVFALLGVLAQAADVRVYVRPAPGQKGAAQAALVQARGQLKHDFDDLNAMAISLPASAVEALRRNPVIEAVEEDPVRGFLGQTTPYGVSLVQAADVVQSGTTGSGIRVGVIDSGVFASHEDLQGLTITGEPDFGPNDQRTWYRDFNSHGTHVVGTIAAVNNSTGVVGVSPGVAIHMVKVFGDTGNWVYSSDLLAAARAAAARGVKIISMSLGGGGASQTENRGLADLYNKSGILLVAAAGNDGNTAVSYPAGYSTVISVAAIDHNKVVASFSQKNSDVELAAPGVAVLSTVSHLDTSSVTVGSQVYSAEHVEFAARGTQTGVLAYGGLGTSTDGSWAGKVVLVDRGTITFYEKVRNVQLSGGIACIIANNEAGDLAATLGDGNSSTIPAVGVTQTTGATLQGKVGLATTVTTTIQENVSAYDEYDGTSMATPHVAGVAALIWSKYPSATNAQVRQALTDTAEDLGTAGRDTSYGYGLVRASEALTKLGALVSGGGGGGGDTTAPVISKVTATSLNGKSGSFEISWTTNEPATSDVTLNGTLFADSALTTNHKRTFKGTRGTTFTYIVTSRDAAGNSASSAPAIFVLP